MGSQRSRRGGMAVPALLVTAVERYDEPNDAVVAGRRILQPTLRIIAYVRHHAGTVRRYDLGGEGDPYLLAASEVSRTRIIRSRISNKHRDWFVSRAAQGRHLWRAVPPTACLAEADPQMHGQLYDDADALFAHFLVPREHGVGVGKVSKVLHLKRPHLYPILDSQLAARYRELAAAAAQRYGAQRHGLSRMFWAAIRDDLVNSTNVAAPARVRRNLASHSDELVRQAADLSDVRLLDILAWLPAEPSVIDQETGP